MKRREMLRASVLAGAVAALRPALANAQSAAQSAAAALRIDAGAKRSGRLEGIFGVRVEAAFFG